uniref:Uncharacterized protein n=1 Tax=Arundo donax TaxID=35708 RepID=A0A0A9AWG0_ARUDO
MIRYSDLSRSCTNLLTDQRIGEVNWLIPCNLGEVELGCGFVRRLLD